MFILNWTDLRGTITEKERLLIKQDCEEEGRGWSTGMRWKDSPRQKGGFLSLDT